VPDGADDSNRADVAMKAAVAYVRMHPGCSKAEVTRGTGSRLQSIDRAIGAGLIRAERLRGNGPYSLYPTADRGRSEK